MKHKINRIQRKHYNVGLCIINKTYLSSYHDKMHILKNGYCRLSHFDKSTS